MNGTSFLLLLVFAVIGYVIHPMALPKLQDKGFGPTNAESGEGEAGTNETAKGKNSEAGTEPTVADTTEKPRVTDESTEPEMNGGNNDSANTEPKPEPAPVTAPTPEPEPKPEPVVTKLSSEQIVNAMKSSVKEGKLKEFQFSQVQDWKSLENETIEGVEYQIGLASFKAKTLFGEQTHDAKALFKKGNLVMWVWAANNFQMQ